MQFEDYQAVGFGCYTIAQYMISLDRGLFIKDGYWWEDDYNTIGKADPREIEIADLFKSTKIKQNFNRLAFLDI